MADIYLQFSDCGQHIRKWSAEPFEGCLAYLDRQATAARFDEIARDVASNPTPEAKFLASIYRTLSAAIQDLDSWTAEIRHV